VSAFAACVADFTAPESEPKNQADERRTGLVELQTVESRKVVEETSPGRVTQSRRVGQVKDRVAH
jgi:hypothetical protein